MFQIKLLLNLLSSLIIINLIFNFVIIIIIIIIIIIVNFISFIKAVIIINFKNHNIQLLYPNLLLISTFSFPNLQLQGLKHYYLLSTSMIKPLKAGYLCSNRLCIGYLLNSFRAIVCFGLIKNFGNSLFLFIFLRLFYIYLFFFFLYFCFYFLI